MLSHWLSSWYTTQQQEPFNDQYEATEGEWVQVLTPDKRKQQQPSNVETNEPSPTLNEKQDEPHPPITVTKQETSVMKSEEPAVIEPNEEVTKKIEEKNQPPQQQQQQQQQEKKNNNKKSISKSEEVVTEKGLSRQEKRAMARMAEREKKKQARNAAMLLSRRGKNISTNCLPASPLIVE